MASTATDSRSRCALDRLAGAVVEKELVRQAGQLVVETLMADLVDEISVVERGSGNGGHALKHLLVGFAERFVADSIRDHQPQIAALAVAQQHPDFVGRRRPRCYPRAPAPHERARRLFERSQHLVGLDARVGGHRGIEQVGQPGPVSLGSEVLAEDEVHQCERKHRERWGPPRDLRRQAGHESERDGTRQAKHLEAQVVEQDRSVLELGDQVERGAYDQSARHDVRQRREHAGERGPRDSRARRCDQMKDPDRRRRRP